MSRIQTILDKAEREGAVRRIRPLPEPPPAGATSGEATALQGAPPASAVTWPVPAEARGEAPPLPAAAPALSAPGRLDRRLVVATAADSVPAEQYRALRTRIMHTDSGGAVSVVLVTSPGRGEGKSLTAANLGLTMAQDHQQRTCIVDADLRAPQQASLFGIPQAPGLSDVLLGRVALDQALLQIDGHEIAVLPAGAPAAHPAELLSTGTMRRVLDTLRTRFDRVIIDVPAATPLADVAILSPLVDSVLLVVRAGVTPKPAIQDAVSAIDPGKLLGFVLNEAAP